MKTKIKLPLPLVDAVNGYCKTQGRVPQIFYQQLIEIFFAGVGIVGRLGLLQPTQENNHTLNIELDRKVYNKAKALAEFFDCRIGQALASIVITACEYKSIFSLLEYDYKLFVKRNHNILAAF